MRLTLTTAESIPTQPSVSDAQKTLIIDAMPNRKLAISTMESDRERKLKRQAYYLSRGIPRQLRKEDPNI